MNSNSLLDLLQTGFRVSLGATTSLVETLQNPQKREETLSEMSTQLSQRVTEWAQKGEITEQEARRLLEEMLGRQANPGRSTATEAPPDTSTAPPSPPTSPNTQLEIQELTAQIAAIRAELEKLRDSGQGN